MKLVTKTRNYVYKIMRCGTKYLNYFERLCVLECTLESTISHPHLFIIIDLTPIDYRNFLVTYN